MFPIVKVSQKVLVFSQIEEKNVLLRYET